MPELLRMPEVAAGATSAVLSSWSVPEGSAFPVRAVIAVIETDKAIVDFEAESAGVILRRLVSEGADVPIGDPIALVAGPDEAVHDIDAALATALGHVAPAVVATPSTSGSGSTRIFASPLARMLARERGIDLSTVVGTGPNGRVRQRDLSKAGIGAQGQAPTSPPVPLLTSPPTQAVPAEATPFTDVPHSRLRKAVAARLQQSKQEAPHFYLRGTARVDRLLALRAELNAGEDSRVSINDLVIKAVARAHRLVPAVNVIWMGDAIRQFAEVDIAVAVATEHGLVTPVLRGVDALSIAQVAIATKDFADRARAGTLRQHELEGGSTSVTNLGMFGTEEFAAIINPPQSTILAVGAARPEPVVDDGMVAVGTLMRVTLSVDHRPIDGASAASWMAAFVGLLEQPAKILA
ncbi:MAG: dihydrolipoamide acetyltransferase family protein [Actinomycetota bacterium]|nr:dihydrolipoamide acetyltransferase family protein [Actinomycetota bacterium]